MGRRVRKEVFIYDDGWPQENDPDEQWHFVYDGWNVVMVLDGLNSNATTRKYTWALDLSGTIHGAGGIGGLLACVETQGEQQGTYWFLYDANGNVGQVLDATDTGNITIAATYEYDPYGNVIHSSGPYADLNPFRFSTKWFDEETGLGYWGYRYYSPRLGRWISRDPIGEEGGLNLHAFTVNDPVDETDPDGLAPPASAPAFKVKVAIVGEMYISLTLVVPDVGYDPGIHASITWQVPLDENKKPLCPCTRVAFSQIVKTEHDSVGSRSKTDWHMDKGSNGEYGVQTPWTPATRWAEMSDDPGSSSPNLTYRIKQYFESVAVCTAGPDKGTAYGAVTWGYEISWKKNNRKDKRNKVIKWAAISTGAANTGWEIYCQASQVQLGYAPGMEPSDTWKKLYEKATGL